MDGQELFIQTDTEHDHWFATGSGISKSFVGSAYENMDVETARKVRDELNEVIKQYKEFQSD